MPEPKRYYLEMKMNGHDVRLKLDSGCDKALISKALWSKIEEPKLLPVYGIGRRSVTGVVPLKGVFLAKMSFAGINFRCPVHVSDDDNTRNMIGRRALPFLVDFDWNTFISEGTIAMLPSNLTMTDDEKKQEMMNDAVKWRTLPFYVNVLVDGKDFMMKLDTGAGCSMAGLAKWEELGKPKLTTVKRMTIMSTSNEPVPLLGRCSLNITYNGVTAKLPLLIADTNSCQVVLGINWIDSLNIDLNTIFRSLQYNKSPRQPPPKQTRKVKDCGDGSQTEDQLAPQLTPADKPIEQPVAGPSVSDSEQDVATEQGKVVRKCHAQSPPPDLEAKKARIVQKLKSSATSPSASRSQSSKVTFTTRLCRK
jgi:hypothetical protein